MTYSPRRVSYPPYPQEPISLLSVSAAVEDHASLRRILHGANWEVVETFTGQEAKTLLDAHKMSVVICADNLSSNGWKSLFTEACQLPDAPKLILSLRLAHESIWAEALSLGCYDVLLAPYEAEEVVRVVSLAWNRWKRECGGQIARAKSTGQHLA